MKDHAEQLAARLATVDLVTTNPEEIRLVASEFLKAQGLGLVQIYRVTPLAERLELTPIVDIASPNLPLQSSRAVADRLALQAASGNADAQVPEPLDDGGQLMRAAAPVRDARGVVVGVVVASDHLTGQLAQYSRRIIDAYQGTNNCAC